MHCSDLFTTSMAKGYQIAPLVEHVSSPEVPDRTIRPKNHQWSRTRRTLRARETATRIGSAETLGGSPGNLVEASACRRVWTFSRDFSSANINSSCAFSGTTRKLRTTEPARRDRVRSSVGPSARRRGGRCGPQRDAKQKAPTLRKTEVSLPYTTVKHL